jgi:hypothetical protein
MSKSGNEVLLRARTHFRASRTVEALEKIAVPEWETEIFYWPEMSVDEKRAVFRHLRAGSGGLEVPLDGMLAAAVTQVCLRARDAYGNRLFGDDQEEDLRDTHPDILQRISNEMGWGSRPSLEDAEKN